jgi:hypothetical protein
MVQTRREKKLDKTREDCVCAYRLGGSSLLRDLDLATGSYDLTTDSGTDPPNEETGSSSLRGSGVLDVSSEALRRNKGRCMYAEGARTRGRVLTSGLYGSQRDIGL